MVFYTSKLNFVDETQLQCFSHTKAITSGYHFYFNRSADIMSWNEMIEQNSVELLK